MGTLTSSLITCVLSVVPAMAAAAAIDETAGETPLAVVRFASGSAQLAGEASDELGDTLRWLDAHPGRLVYVEGYADRRGGSAANLELSYQRSLAVRDELVQRGADPFRVIVAAHGEDRDLGSAPPTRSVVISGSEHRYDELIEAQRRPTPPPPRRPQAPPPARPNA
ncbi:MAG TPA: OmpA family protein [Kofleriaceae bacterium]|jgi:hypothetical protein|nr:OmpA family protein [Kofleriaceae bacterium]